MQRLRGWIEGILYRFSRLPDTRRAAILGMGFGLLLCVIVMILLLLFGYIASLGD